jgi:hypothetical protein
VAETDSAPSGRGLGSSGWKDSALQWEGLQTHLQRRGPTVVLGPWSDGHEGFKQGSDAINHSLESPLWLLCGAVD